MDQSTYIVVAIVFAVFLGTVILSNLAALLVTGIINRLAKRKAKRL